MTIDKVIEAHILSSGTSAQKSELIALTSVLELSQDRWINIYTDSKYAFMIVHAHGAILKEIRLLPSGNKDIKYLKEVLNLLGAVSLSAQGIGRTIPK